MAVINNPTYKKEGKQYILTLEQDGITFDNIKVDGVSVDQTVVVKGSFAQVNDGTYKPSIHAIDINWDNAQVAGQTIESSGQLLNIIQLIENIMINI